MTRRIRLAISTCPNDTFAFHGLITRSVDWRGLDFEIDLVDIEQLNERLVRDDFDVIKVSFHAALTVADRIVVLPSGSAIGFGVGPLLLSASADTKPSSSEQLTLCPGRLTTAAMLFNLFHHQTSQVEHVVFSDILPRLAAGLADFGVCIHEGRFTWQSHGLHLVEDLGSRWETETGGPLPLGGIVASRRLARDTIAAAQAVIHDSLLFALRDRSTPLPTMRRHAQEFDDAVLMRHVDLYVNEWTLDLGTTGATALSALSDRTARVGLWHGACLTVFAA